ncbi:RNA polymerase sigma factor FliA [Inmirania thermothiophila]|uniref:RNA polymerase sigma factor FliA n=1 Tax=Inmirania thermothiophila TaxID=1750597 RepID=A0A3N1Y7Y8_9GAMM|nr:RNA polymerase sigma factor FliA [Inmirania thermothiophila]ROR34946.1 RNA polymerase sigma-28 (SigD/FliA/WhiG) subunit [Inmirania thermothiophila]
MIGAAGYEALAEQDRAALVERHAPLVKRIAHHLMHRLPPTVQLEDLLQAGVVGLLEAARNFDPSHGASFETYAGIRIRGAMLDEVRRHDWVPRSVHRKSRMVAEAIQEIERREGREARDEEVAAVLGIGLDEYHRILQDASSGRLFSFEEVAGEGGELIGGEDPGADPLAAVEAEDLRQAVARAIGELSEREQLVLALYYDEELNLREIGAVLGVTESRVCQIHGKAMLRLRARVREWMGEARG